MREPMVIIWRASSDARLIDVRASADGSPQLVERDEVTERVVDDEKELLEYLRNGHTEHIAVPRDLAHATLGWDL